jgi:hypothetical protein
MNPFRAWTRPLALVEQMIGLFLLGALWYWWLGIAESTTARLLLSIAALAAFIAGIVLLIRRGRSRLGDPANPGSTGKTLAALLLLFMSLCAAYYLVWWVPEVSGIKGQMASVALRFGAGFLLVVTFWANLLSTMSRRPTAA